MPLIGSGLNAVAFTSQRCAMKTECLTRWPWLSLFLVFISSGCGAIESYSKLDQPENATLRASVGQTVFRLQRSKDLPNAFGRADIFGRKTSTGYQEMRYLGMADESTAIFAFRDQEIYSNETTMSRSGMGFVNLQHTQTSTTGTVIVPPSSTTQALPTYEVQFRHNIREQPVFEHSGIRISIIKTTPTELTYSLSK